MTGKGFTLLAQWYDQRPNRERALLLLSLVALLVLLVNFLLFQPVFRERDTAVGKVTELKADLSVLGARETAILARKNRDPDRENRLRLATLEQESAKLREQLEANIVNLVSPQEMPDLLKELLTRQKKLQLLSLENLPPQRLDLEPENAEKGTVPPLYRHRLRMEFSGDYLTMLTYLRELEALPRAMIWEDVDIETRKYPETTVRLQVYTLSLTEGWIGG